MERRIWTRNSVALDVEIKMWRPEGEQVLRCKTVNVCLGGIEILCYGNSFPQHRVLELRFTKLCNSHIRQPRILSKFIRATERGMVIQFLKANNDTLKGLQQLMLKDKIMQNRMNQPNCRRA